MIIPIAIEGVEMKFLVDTGVGRTLIFDTHKAKQLGFDHDRPVFLRGLGDQPALEAYHVHFNRMHIGDFYLKISMPLSCQKMNLFWVSVWAPTSTVLLAMNSLFTSL